MLSRSCSPVSYQVMFTRSFPSTQAFGAVKGQCETGERKIQAHFWLPYPPFIRREIRAYHEIASDWSGHSWNPTSDYCSSRALNNFRIER